MKHTNLEKNSKILANSDVMGYKKNIVDFDPKWSCHIINHLLWHN